MSIVIVIFIAYQFTSYKYNKENPRPETELSNTSLDRLSDNNISSNDETASDNITLSNNNMVSSNDTIPDNNTFSVDAATSDSNTKSGTSVSDNELISADGKLTLEGDGDMSNADRVIYHEGFYYEPLSEDVKKRIYGLSYKEDCTIPYEDLRYVSVLYKDFNNHTAYGELICNKAIAQDLVEIFYELFENEYQIEKIRLIDEYGADDDISCQENNTSCFNYRVVAGSTKLSKHALGLAIDINPFYNPYVTYPNGVERISPPGSEPYANRDADLPHMIQKGDLIYNLFIERGFTWGGEWNSLKDYQHFQKTID